MRLIDAEALMKALNIADDCTNCKRKGNLGCKEDPSFMYACECITDAPTVDAVEVVRCKDCEYMIFNRESTKFGTCWQNGLVVPLGHFCSLAERKEDE